MAFLHGVSRTSAQDTLGAAASRMLVASAVLAVLAIAPFFRSLGGYEFDLLTSLTAPAPPQVDVLVVGLDEASLTGLGLAPPIARRFHADLVHALTEAGASALGVDMLFPEPQAPDDDRALQQALRGPMPVVLASARVQHHSSQLANYTQQLPTVFPDAIQGDIVIALDADGVPRRAPAQADALWRVLAQQAGRAVVVPPEGALLRYYAPEVPMAYAHYTQALDAAQQLAPGAVRGRIVLMGQNTPVGGMDQFRTPFSLLGGGSQAGVFLHATALQNGLQGDWIKPLGWPVAALAALLAMGAAAALTRRWSALRSLAVHAALGVVAVVAGTAAFAAGW